MKKRGCNMLFAVIRWAVLPVLKWVFIRQVSGLDRLPPPPFIVVANHGSYLDAPLVMTVFSPRMVHFVVWERLASIPVLSGLIRVCGGIFENGSMAKLFGVLAKGRIVGIFPEGGRTHDGKVRQVSHSGLGVLAALSGVPVVPLRLVGAFEAWPWKRRFPRLKKMVDVRISNPIGYVGKKNRRDYVKFGNQVMKKIERL